MARQSRLEYPGACYHVINRGNYRSFIFETEGARTAFALTLAEAATRFQWLVHAWVVMGNHYHLALETPEANLSRGMQWLQSTFSTRFNRFRGENGHVFQGRYRAIHLDPAEALGPVCHYIDLNPARAGLVAASRLESYAFGSFSALMRPKERPAWLRVGAGLQAAGGLADTPNGRCKYHQFLVWLTQELAEDREKEYLRLCEGWALGGEAFKAALAQVSGEEPEERALDPASRQQWREEQWERRCATLLAKIRPSARQDPRPSALWKAQVAAQMKQSTDVTNAWLAHRLGLSTPAYASKQAATWASRTTAPHLKAVGKK